jgi:hypothetical protein
MAISIRQSRLLVAFAALLSMIGANSGAQQDNNREVKPVDVSVHDEIDGPPLESRQPLELSQPTMPMNAGQSRKIYSFAGTCPEPRASGIHGTYGETIGSANSSSNLARWSVSAAGQSSQQKFGPGRTDLAPAEDCAPDPQSGKPADRITVPDTPRRRYENDDPSISAHPQVVAVPIGRPPDVENPFSPLSFRKQSGSFEDVSPMKVKIPKGRSQKKRLAPDDPWSPGLQDSIETGNSRDEPKTEIH